ncbi:hypothetical protein GGI42DRAFT_8393 [Trichoderma sp. SZMC 28013]
MPQTTNFSHQLKVSSDDSRICLIVSVIPRFLKSTLLNQARRLPPSAGTRGDKNSLLRTGIAILLSVNSPIMFRPHPEESMHLRLHRARSVVLTSEELVEIRAAQRTFEGAYMRTALGLFSFSLVILKVFTEEFYPIGALFAAFGTAILLVSMYRRYQGHRQFFVAESPDGVLRRKFRTSGDTVLLLTALSLCAYSTLLALTWRLKDV